MDELVPLEAKVDIDKTMRQFKVVFIPHDLSKEIQEEVVTQAPDRALSAMFDFAKLRFQENKLQGSNLHEFQKDLASKHGGGSIPQETMNHLADVTLCEVVPLLATSLKTCFVGVNMVVDDKASSKQLPINERATAISHRCLVSMQINGDCFICRQFDNDEGFYRLDFTTKDLQSELWLISLCRAIKSPPGTSTALLAKQFKDAGNDCFKLSQYLLAIVHYKQGILFCGTQDGEIKSQLLSNLSACRLRLGQVEAALKDADLCLAVRPTWNKAWGRRAEALKALGNREEEARDAFTRAGLVV